MNNLFRYDNKIKNKIDSGGIALGVFMLSGNSYIAESIANFAIDWILVDLEASHTSKSDLLHILQALNGYDPIPMVRIPDHSRHMAEFSLDLGAKGIMIPKIESGQQAFEAVEACFYPPKGDRGINCIRASGYYTHAKQYFDNANDCICSIVQIESRKGIDNLEEIVRQKNVDIVFIGPGDLASSYGQNGQVSGPRMDMARQKVIAACQKHRKIAGIFAHSTESISQYIKEGFKFIGIGNDIKFINQGLAQSLNKIL